MRSILPVSRGENVRHSWGELIYRCLIRKTHLCRRQWPSILVGCIPISTVLVKRCRILQQRALHRQVFGDRTHHFVTTSMTLKRPKESRIMERVSIERAGHKQYTLLEKAAVQTRMTDRVMVHAPPLSPNPSPQHVHSGLSPQMMRTAGASHLLGRTPPWHA